MKNESMFNNPDFYPTPTEVLDKMLKDVDWSTIRTVLEPSAGKGDIVEYVMNKANDNYSYRRWGNGGKEVDIDCIELNDELRALLKGKGYRVVHDDFLTFSTFKHYDLIVMNPPFSRGAAHLTHALRLQKDGGGVVCVLNAETIRNPYTNERKALIQELKDINAEVTFMTGAFKNAERQTTVEIAVVKAYYPEKERESYIYDGLKKKFYSEGVESEVTDVAPNDFVKAIVAQYNLEVESGVKLIQEYKALRPHILQSVKKDELYNDPILKLEVYNKNRGVSTNDYVREVRRKYWTALFKNPKFTGQMTNQLQSEYSKKVADLVNYDFSVYNIKCLQEEMSRHLIQGIEDCIVKLFDELSAQYSYIDETSNNIHYYNGWKTNKSWYINKKVILPYMRAFSTWSGDFDPNYEVKSKLSDIERALNYLDGGLTDAINLDYRLEQARNTRQTKKIELKYFYVTFYKKGTCHIEFKNEELLKKLNIFGSQQKGWLPPAYGKVKYQDMTAEEQAVVNEFDGGKAGYDNVINKADYFIYNPANSVPRIADVA